MNSFIFLLLCKFSSNFSHTFDRIDENRPRHERRSSREDLDVRRSNDPPSRQPPYPGQAPARKPPGGVGGKPFTFSSVIFFQHRGYPF